MILTHESGSQEDQFDEKKWRQKISWDYPFKGKNIFSFEMVFFYNSNTKTSLLKEFILLYKRVPFAK